MAYTDNIIVCEVKNKMQLLIILALLLYGGSNANNVLNEVKPVLESIGGEDMQKALKSAEEISTVLNAVKSFAGASKPQSEEARACPLSFPLEPVANIADKEITYSLNKYLHSESGIS